MVIKTQVKTLKDINLENLLGQKSVYVGYPENSNRSDSDLTDAEIAFLNTNGTYPTAVSKEIAKNRKEGDSYSTALSAYIRTHGDPKWHIPPRPFVEPGVETVLPKIIKDFREAIITNLMGLDNSDILHRIGMRARNAIQKFIRSYPENNLTPNAPSTIKKKGEDHPLKGKTGELLSHVTYVIEE